MAEASPQPPVVPGDDPQQARYEVRLRPLPPLPELRAAWQSLEAHSRSSFFLGWPWIGTWLALICPLRHARLVTVSRKGRTVAMGVFTLRRRFLGMGPRHLRLHETGDRELDRLTMEYNGLLCERGHERGALAAVIDHLAMHDHRWLTLYLPGMPVDDVPFEKIRTHGIAMRLNKHSAHRVELDALRASGQSYVQGALSSRARGAVRRTARKVEAAFGALAVSVAHGPEERLAFFRAMAHLHESHWSEEERKHGAFSDPRIMRFHETLVVQEDLQGGAQLIRLSAGRQTLGYVYCFRWKGIVYFYQAGIDYRRFGEHGSPGLLLLTRCIEYALATGATRFELMAGDAEYKRTLGMAESKMVWLSLDRDGISSRLRRAWWQLRGVG